MRKDTFDGSMPVDTCGVQDGASGAAASGGELADVSCPEMHPARPAAPRTKSGRYRTMAARSSRNPAGDLCMAPVYTRADGSGDPFMVSPRVPVADRAFRIPLSD